MITIKLTPEQKRMAVLCLVVFTMFLAVFISLKSKNNQIEDLKNQVYELKVAQDTLSLSNKDFIKQTKQLEVKFDSIYLVIKKSNEIYIVHHWDSVYRTIINNPDQTQISNFLRELGQN